MNTEQAKQLRLAADIIETGHPWEPWHVSNQEWSRAEPDDNAGWFALNPTRQIRLVLATPPDGRPLHNPDNLTAEQVGAGFRLALPDEKLDQNYEYWISTGGWEKGQRKGLANDLNPGASMRLPLSVPWPEAEKPDPYAELKKAHADGKVIQVRPKVRTKDWHDEWQDCIPTWGDDYEYRVKPEPTFQLPPAPPGMQWHRKDWTADDLPQGWRPLMEGEQIQAGDEISYQDNTWDRMNALVGTLVDKGSCKKRTRRPLTFEHAVKSWTWHRPGDPMPCDGDARIHYLTKEVEHSGVYSVAFAQRADSRNWDSASSIIGWRYADEKKTVPLGPEDVPPGSVFRPIGWSSMPNTHVNYEAVVTNGVRTIEVDWSPFCSEHGYLPWSELENDWQINRSIPLTGKWDSNAWGPCSKQI